MPSKDTITKYRPYQKLRILPELRDHNMDDICDCELMTLKTKSRHNSIELNSFGQIFRLLSDCIVCLFARFFRQILFKHHRHIILNGLSRINWLTFKSCQKIIFGTVIARPIASWKINCLYRVNSDKNTKSCIVIDENGQWGFTK